MITAIIGPMFSGKSEKLIGIYDEIFNKQKVLCFKPSKDTRDTTFIRSRNRESKVPALVVSDFSDIRNIVRSKQNLGFNGRIILIDEVQFIKGEAKILFDLSHFYGFDIYVSGLALTSEQNSFGCMHEILCYADEIIKLTSSWHNCGKPANYTFYLGHKDEDILVGSDEYIPLCGKCLLDYQSGNYTTTT